MDIHLQFYSICGFILTKQHCNNISQKVHCVHISYRDTFRNRRSISSDTRSRKTELSKNEKESK